MAEAVASRKQTKTYNTQRFKRRSPETEGSDTPSGMTPDNFFERVSLLQYFVIIFGLVAFEVSYFPDKTNFIEAFTLSAVYRLLFTRIAYNFSSIILANFI